MRSHLWIICVLGCVGGKGWVALRSPILRDSIAVIAVSEKRRGCSAFAEHDGGGEASG